MIVRSTQSGWRIVFQSQHGLVAGELARQLNVDGRLPFWEETCVATTLHDDHKKAFEVGQHRYLTESGVPMDYAMVPMDAEKRFEDTRQRIDEAIKKHRWIALLLSKHVDFLYCDEDSIDDDMRQLLASESDRRTRVLSQINKTDDELDACYAWMKWCDRCSLILCGDDVPAMNRRVEIMPLPDGTLSFLHQDQDETVRIEPWPFKTQQVTIDLEERTLSQLQFADDAELWSALMDCEPECRSIDLCA